MGGNTKMFKVVQKYENFMNAKSFVNNLLAFVEKIGFQR
jgi:hypothetical protein